MNKDLLKENVVLWISRDARIRAKLQALLQGKTMKDYVEELIKKDESRKTSKMDTV